MQGTVKTLSLHVLAIFLLCNAALASDIVAIGDSMMKTVGRAIRRQYAAQNVSTEVFTSIGSGLARMDLLDWHIEAARLMVTHRPAWVFVMLGANDNQAMQIGSSVLAFGSSEWDSEYGRRAGKLMDTLLDGGAKRVIWIGLPVMRERKLDADARAIEQIVIKQAKQRANVLYLPTFEMFSSPSGYKAYIVLANGMPLEARSEDGIHLNRDGALHLAVQLFEKFPPQDIRSIK